MTTSSTSRFGATQAPWLVLWTALGAVWLVVAVSGWADAAAAHRRVFVLPMVAGALTASTGLWALISAWRGSRAPVSDVPGELEDHPDVPGTLLDVVILGALLVGAWFVMPYLGLVVTAMVLFIALCLVYRDVGWVGIVVNVVILFLLLAYGAGDLLNMPLMRSRLFDLPF